MFNLFNVPLQKQIIRERKRRSQEIECVLSPAKFPLSDFVCFLSRQAGSDLGPPAGWARPAGRPGLRLPSTLRPGKPSPGRTRHSRAESFQCEEKIGLGQSISKVSRINRKLQYILAFLCNF